MSTAKQRRAAAHRKLEKQLEKRQELERQRKQQTIVLSLVAALVVIGLVTWFAVASSDNKTTADGCGFTPDSGEPAVGMPITDESELKTTGTVNLAMQTTRGDLSIELDRTGAPCAVASFEHLAEAGFFDNTICHRLTTGSFGVLQCGDPTGTGTGGPGYHFNEEPPSGDDPYPVGTVAMANSGSAGSTGSQFFICYTSCSSLPPDYSVVGEVTSGLQVVKDIAAKGTDNGTSDGAPAEEVMITKLAIA